MTCTGFSNKMKTAVGFLSQRYSSLNGVFSTFAEILRKQANPLFSGQKLFFILSLFYSRDSLVFLSEKLNDMYFRFPLLTIFNQLRSIYNVLCTVLSAQETNTKEKDMTLVSDTLIEMFLGRARFIHKKQLLCNHFFTSLHLFHSFNHYQKFIEIYNMLEMWQVQES